MVNREDLDYMMRLEPETLAEISMAFRESPGPIATMNAGFLHPFGLPTVHRDLWQQDLVEMMQAEGVPIPPHLLKQSARKPQIISGPYTAISLESYCGIIEHDVSDQVVVVKAGTSIDELQEALAEQGQCLPFPALEPASARATATMNGPISDEIAFNLPHPLRAQCGSWRDWILGMKIVSSDGTISKCGSKAVKSVAGYDVQKLMVGSRNTLAVVLEVTLRTYPLKGLPEPEVQFLRTKPGPPANWIQRVLRTDFKAALESHNTCLTAFDEASSTLWGIVTPGQSLKRYESDWVLRSGCGEENLEFKDATQVRFMKRAKELFDPISKLNPGEMGIF